MSEPYETDAAPLSLLLRAILFDPFSDRSPDAPTLEERVGQALDRVMTLRLIEADWTARDETRRAMMNDTGTLFSITGAGDAMEAAAVLEAAGFDVHTARKRNPA